VPTRSLQSYIVNQVIYVAIVVATLVCGLFILAPVIAIAFDFNIVFNTVTYIFRDESDEIIITNLFLASPLSLFAFIFFISRRGYVTSNPGPGPASSGGGGLADAGTPEQNSSAPPSKLPTHVTAQAGGGEGPAGTGAPEATTEHLNTSPPSEPPKAPADALPSQPATAPTTPVSSLLPAPKVPRSATAPRTGVPDETARPGPPTQAPLPEPQRQSAESRTAEGTPGAHRWPIVSIVVVLLILLSALDWNNNHKIRQLLPSVKADSPTVVQAFEKWSAQRDKRKAVYIVAAQGGGIYAAYHAGMFLDTVEDKYPEFAQHIFAISGVSGGSLGAAIFGSLVHYQENKKTGTTERIGIRNKLKRS